MNLFNDAFDKQDASTPEVPTKPVDHTVVLAQETAQEPNEDEALQLLVDVFQSDSEVVIYAQLAGMDMQTLDVSITGNNDTVSIKGSALRPEYLIRNAHKGQGGQYALEECHWGEFYRQIVLPKMIDSDHAEAKTREGVLVLRFPLVNQQSAPSQANTIHVTEDDISE